MGRLDGKVALISGGARGQGATEAKLFAREGAKVVFGDMLDDAGRQVEADIRAAGGEATYVYLDVTRDDDWREAVGTAVNRYGKLDILVNNAGIIRRFSVEETTREVWDAVMAVNSTGVFLGTKDPPYTQQRERRERQRLLMGDLTAHDAWVVSGSLCGWGDVAIPLFELVVFLSIPHDIRMERL